MGIDSISQIAIFILGVSSILLVARKNRWGFVTGFLTQPFFFITSYIHRQWGIFFVSIAYTFSWIYGIYEWFYKDKRQKLKNNERVKNENICKGKASIQEV